MIDWFTVAAQIVNFVILIVLLRVFLYGPVVNAMQRRKRAIESQVEEAENTSRRAGEKVEEYERKSRKLDEDRERILDEAKESAEEERRKLVARAREQADEKRQTWISAVEDEKNTFRKSLRNRLGAELIAALEGALSDLADARLERQMAAVLCRRLRALGNEERDHFASQVSGNGDRVVVRTSSELSDDSQHDIVDALSELLHSEADVEFEIDENGEAGIAVTTGGYRIGWTVGDYLDRLQSRVAAELDAVKRKGGDDDA